MNSRQRILTALQHKEPDRVPIDLDGMAASGIAAMAYLDLRQHLGLPQEAPTVWDPFQLLAAPDHAILERFGVDTRPVRMPIPGLDVNQPAWKPWRLPDDRSCLVPAGFNPVQQSNGDWAILDHSGHIQHRLPAGGFYFDQVHYPLAEATTLAEIESYSLNGISTFSPDELEWVNRQARAHFELTDKAVVCRFRGSLVEVACSLRGWERFMTDLLIEPILADALLSRLTEHYLQQLPGYLAAVGDYAQVIVLGDDLGNQNSTFFSPDLYRRMIKPYHRQVVQAIKQNSNLFVLLHSDGAIRKLIPDLIEIGVDILNPVQFSARDMHPATLKREFGDDIVFWGAGADTQHVLPFASPDEVRRHVRRLVETMAPGGGFVFTQLHNIQAGVPPQNLVAMWEAALEYGVY